MFYHVHLATDYSEGKYTNTKDYYRTDLSEAQLHQFLDKYRRGTPLVFGKDTVSLNLLKYIIIKSTQEASATILPPLKTAFLSKAATEKARRDEENRRSRVAFIGLPDTSEHFFADRTLMSVAEDRTTDFIEGFTTTPEAHVPSGASDPEVRGLAPSVTIRMQQQRRFRYLEFLYEVSGGDSSRMFHWREVGAALAMTDDAAAVACRYLREKKLTNGTLMTDGISQPGIDEYEQAVTKPDQATAHFQPHVIITGVQGSNITVGSPGSHQFMTNTNLSPDMAAVSEVILDLRQALPRFDMDQALREDIEVQVTELEVQVSQQSPNPRKVRSVLRSAQSLLGNLSLNVAANIAAPQIMDQIHKLIAMFPS